MSGFLKELFRRWKVSRKRGGERREGKRGGEGGGKEGGKEGRRRELLVFWRWKDL